MNNGFTAIDLFSGCGGLTTGLKQAGFDVLASVEVDIRSADVYKRNHPEVQLWTSSISLVESYSMMRKLKLKSGDLDLVAACPPCQGFSTVRTLNGGRVIVDERNDLVLDVIRFVQTFLPSTVLFENVPGLGEDERFARVVKMLQQKGYSVEYQIVNAADYAVPQRRRRLILLAGRFGRIRFARQARIRRTVREVIGELPLSGDSGDPVHDFPDVRTRRIRRLIQRIPKDGGSRSDLSKRSQLPCHRRCDGFKDIYGRMAWDDVAPTLTTGCFNPSRGRFLHPSFDRAITIREAALIQTFPKEYTFPAEFGKAKLANMIGNAMPPELVRRQALAVKRYLQRHKRD